MNASDLDSLLARYSRAADLDFAAVLDLVSPDCRAAVAGRLAALRTHAFAVGAIASDRAALVAQGSEGR